MFILTVGMIVTAGLFYTGYLRFNYPSSTEYPIRGIDVSHHQHKIDWVKVKKQNIQFAYIKATEGGDFKDKRFIENWNEAMSAGIDLGAYHFFTFCKTGRQQAKNFIETVPVLSGALPPVIDLEFGGNCELKRADELVMAEIDTLQKLLGKQYRKTPIFYVTKEFYDRFMVGKFPDNPIWIRDIYCEPTLVDNRKWEFWQYANRGHLGGIDMYVDLNVFNGTKKEYEKLKENYSQ